MKKSHDRVRVRHIGRGRARCIIEHSLQRSDLLSNQSILSHEVRTTTREV